MGNKKQPKRKLIQPKSKQTKAKSEKKALPEVVADILSEALDAERIKQHSEIITRWREVDANQQSSVDAALRALNSFQEELQAERTVIIDEVHRLESLSNRSSDEGIALNQLTARLHATKPTGLPKKFEDLKKQVEEQRKRNEAMFPTNWSEYFVKDGSNWRSTNRGVLMKCTQIRRKQLPGTTVQRTIGAVAKAFIGSSYSYDSLRKDYYRTDVTLPSNIDEIADTLVALMTKGSRGT